MVHTAVLVAEEAAEHASAISPLLLGVLAFGGFVVALLATYAFRHANNKH
ncbi:hypothetical protein [Isoptericola dokdonensis]|uniref:Uncharacterized protein n=1 Tax=Isoptericola dokdonensis DS-3 TaxID=1300344 RepID=A0A168E9A0_9MICO|nr:hypothetical protein [Isoptericola dokdonensis]ANC29753.1 hypothetical protein I598_0160 [Isoptericola dokdonensis DS-3]